jgi:hypothetical protein
MDGGSSEESEARFAAYVEALGVLGHADRQQPMHDYCLGLLMPIERKERRTDGGGNGTRTSQTPIVASFYPVMSIFTTRWCCDLPLSHCSAMDNLINYDNLYIILRYESSAARHVQALPPCSLPQRPTGLPQNRR